MASLSNAIKAVVQRLGAVSSAARSGGRSLACRSVQTNSWHPLCRRRRSFASMTGRGAR